MKLTEEQKTIVEASKGDFDILRINAYAGTGKTTTLVEIAKANPHKRFLYLAFNRSIAEEARQKFPSNVIAYTTHSFALRQLKKNGFKAKLKDDLRKEMKEFVISTSNFSQLSEENKSVIIELMSTTISKICNSDLSPFIFANHNSVEEMLYDTQDFEDVYQKVGKYMSINSFITSIALFLETYLPSDIETLTETTHDLYLKLFHIQLGLENITTDEYDVVLLDEAQDTNPVTYEIFNLLKGQKIIVGDNLQKIYGFRGSINILEKYDYSLTTSFRYTQDIADRIKEFTSVLMNHNIDLKGIQKQNTIRTQAELVRSNFELYQTIEKRSGKVISLRNPYAIFQPIFDIIYFERNSSPFNKIFKTKEEFKEFVELTNKYSYIAAFRILERTYNKSKIFALYNKVKETTANKNADVYVSTVHSAKGLEWDKVIVNVNILHILVEKLAYMVAKGDLPANYDEFIENKEVSEELNLYYVALSRGKYEVIEKHNEHSYSEIRDIMEDMITEATDFYLESEFYKDNPKFKSILLQRLKKKLKKYEKYQSFDEDYKVEVNEDEEISEKMKQIIKEIFNIKEG